MLISCHIFAGCSSTSNSQYISSYSSEKSASSEILPTYYNQIELSGYDATQILFQVDSYTYGIMFFQIQFIDEFGEENQGHAHIDSIEKKLNVWVEVIDLEADITTEKNKIIYVVDLTEMHIVSKEIIHEESADKFGLEELSDERLIEIADIFKQIIEKAAQDNPEMFEKEYAPESKSYSFTV